MPLSSLLQQSIAPLRNAPLLRRRIDARQPGELARWARKFDVSEERLRQAISRVGSAVPDVEQELKGQRVPRRLG